MRVGTSAHLPRRKHSNKDHPHACGDKNTIFNEYNEKTGSSPCVWGQARAHLKTAMPNRIIPMRVGTSKQTFRLFVKIWDHPHACGDKTKEIKENSGFAKSTA